MDIEKFLNCVRDNPAIWDNTDSGYNQRIVKEKCWRKIGETLFLNWNQMTSEDVAERIKAMKNKWKGIKDCYMRILKFNRSNPDNKKTYLHSQELKFLENHVPNQSYRRNIDSDDDDSNDDDGSEETQDKIMTEKQQVQKFEEVVLESDNTYIKQEAIQEVATSPPHESYERESRASTPQQVAIKRKITGESEKPVCVRRLREDTDKAFLFSLLPDYRKLSYEQKLEFRMYALGFFKHANDESS